MDYSFLAARLSFTFIYTCIFFSWQINSAAAAATEILLIQRNKQTSKYLHLTYMYAYGGLLYKTCFQNHCLVSGHRQTDRQTDRLKTIPAFAIAAGEESR